MKKSNFIAMILGTIGVVFFALGMCMALLPEWNAFRPGVICGVIGMVVLIIALVVWRKMEHKTPIHLSGKVVGIILLSIVGALALGIGMSLAMVWSQIIYGYCLSSQICDVLLNYRHDKVYWPTSPLVYQDRKSVV